jgi:hypothetical protein
MYSKLPKRIFYLAIIVLLVRIVFIVQFNGSLALNPDEQRNYQIAFNHFNGNGYSIFDSTTQKFYPTAFHNSFPVFVYGFFIRNDINIKYWVVAIWLITILLYIISIKSFFLLCLLFFKDNSRLSSFATLVYLIYPSIVLYIGSLFFYENLALSILIITVYRFALSLKNDFEKSEYILLPLIITFACLLRNQLIFFYGLVSVFLLFRYWILKKTKSILMICLICATLILSLVPTLLKNKQQFGVYNLSNQAGFELLQGHNPTAKGSWMGNWNKPDSDFYKYSHKKISNIENLNEFEESQKRKELAVNWLIQNPWQGMKLTIRKLMIYYYPANFEVIYTYHWFNPINFFVHFFSVLSIFVLLIKRKFDSLKTIIILPIIASIALTVVFFVGYRWRYYAEPFMIIFAVSFLTEFRFKLIKAK